MPRKVKFDSKKELDNLFEIMNINKEAKTPSEILKFYNSLENNLITIYEKGYSDCIEFTKEINNNLN
jgi:hypothetical protein